MDSFLMNMLNINLMSSVFILVVLIFRKVFKKAPKALIMIMWAAVAIRLLCPITINTKFGLLPEKIVDRQESVVSSDVEKHAEAPYEKQVAYVFMGNEDYKVVRNVPTHADPVKAVEQHAVSTEKISKPETAAPVAASDEQKSETGIDIATIIMAAYAAGVLAMITYGIVSYVKVKRTCAAMIPVEKGSNIYICDEIRTGFIMGVFRPKIVLPSGLDKRTKAHVVNHEKMHLKHKDNIWKPLGYLVLTLNWFNPFVWIAYIGFAKDMEMFCDEAVIKTYNDNQIVEYSLALLNLSVNRVSMASLAFGEVNVKERIKSITTYKKPALVFASAATVIALVLTGCFVTNSGAEKKEEPAGSAVESKVEPVESEVEETIIESSEESFEELSAGYVEDYTEYYATEPTETTEELVFDGSSLPFERVDERCDLYTLTDGSDEYTIEVPDEEYYGKIIVTINGKSETLDSNTEWNSLDSAYLIKKDNCKLLITEPSMGENTGIDIYKIDGEKITYAQHYLCVYLDNVITSAYDFVVSESHVNGGCMHCINHFTLDTEGNLVPLSDVWTFNGYSPLCYKYYEDMSGKVVNNGEVTDEVKTIKAETVVKALCTDRNSYVDFETEDGDVVRVEVHEAERFLEDERQNGWFDHVNFVYSMKMDIGGGIKMYKDWMGNWVGPDGL